MLDWTVRYWEKARRAGLPGGSPTSATFYRDLEWMGLQRHLKVLGIFARYPTAMASAATSRTRRASSHYVRAVCERYAALKPLLQLFDQTPEARARSSATASDRIPTCTP